MRVRFRGEIATQRGTTALKSSDCDGSGILQHGHLYRDGSGGIEAELDAELDALTFMAESGDDIAANDLVEEVMYGGDCG